MVPATFLLAAVAVAEQPASASVFWVAAAAAKLRPMAIIRRQMSALRQLVQRFGASAEAAAASLPRFGGWELLEPFVKTGAEHEE